MKNSTSHNIEASGSHFSGMLDSSLTRIVNVIACFMLLILFYLKFWFLA